MFRPLIPLAVAAFASMAQAQGVDRCPAIADAAARLACYDAAFPPTAARAPAQPVPLAAPQPAPAAVAAVTPAGPPSPQPDKAAGFGLAREAAAEVASIQSSTTAGFYGWGRKERIRLQNGQTWEVTDGSSGTLGQPNTKVTVRKAVFGGFVMEFEGLNRAPRVRRVE